MGGYGVEPVASLEEDEIHFIEDTIVIKDGEKLNIILSGCKPECRYCQGNGHLMRDYEKKKGT